RSRGAGRFDELAHVAGGDIQHVRAAEIRVIEPRSRCRREGDAGSIRRPARFADRKIATRDLLLGTTRDGPRPELGHPEVVIDDNGVILDLLARLLAGVVLTRGDEEQRLSIRRELEAAYTGLVLRH